MTQTTDEELIRTRRDAMVKYVHQIAIERGITRHAAAQQEVDEAKLREPWRTFAFEGLLAAVREET